MALGFSMPIRLVDVTSKNRTSITELEAVSKSLHGRKCLRWRNFSSDACHNRRVSMWIRDK